MKEQTRVEIVERLAEHIRNLVAEYGEEWAHKSIVVAPSCYEDDAMILGQLLNGAQVVITETGGHVTLGNTDNYKLCRDFEDWYPILSDLYEKDGAR